MKDKKITVIDLPILKDKVDIVYFKVDGKKINLTPMPHRVIANYTTHADYQDCGAEFKRNLYTKRFACHGKQN